MSQGKIQTDIMLKYFLNFPPIITKNKKHFLAFVVIIVSQIIAFLFTKVSLNCFIYII